MNKIFEQLRDEVLCIHEANCGSLVAVVGLKLMLLTDDRLITHSVP